ncbi:Uncharacterised protein [Serratia marcescens]|uniref:phage tail protein n=1 Tax=Serratia TaxID=613 RepID=UPI00074506EC|nr:MULTISPECIES: phage tail protein [Serratia]MBJ2066944.1 phage tail protein [Serratia odorifera]CVC03250.1 Uncharacterised protein [Serratia marcescens]CVH14895.1 Uncharacterised protein [Serratia marcescens]
MPAFYSILTNIGAEKLALAAQSGVAMAISYMAVGDGGGVSPTPDPAQLTLRAEQYRSELNTLSVSNRDGNVISAEMIIPPEFGGFWIREVGLYSDDGALVAVGNLPDTYKPQLIEGSGRTSTIRMALIVSSTKDVRLLIDPAVVVATTGYVDEKFKEAKNRADDAYQLAADKTTFDDIYPPGISIFFATNLNPNQRWPGTQWYYTGENKSIRIAKQDGSDVLTTGGSDSVRLTKANLPAEALSLTGRAGDTDLGKKKTEKAGKHVHDGVPLRDNAYELGGNNTALFSPMNQGKTDESGEHEHEFILGSHGHDVTGNTEKMGQGETFSIVESHIKLMCWYRAA